MPVEEEVAPEKEIDWVTCAQEDQYNRKSVEVIPGDRVVKKHAVK